MHSARKIAIIPLALLLFVAGCVRMPIPTSVAPSSNSLATGSPTAQAAPSITASPSLTATALPSSSASTPSANGNGNPANGAALFKQLPCTACHDVTQPFPGGAICPNLGNIATEAARIVQSPDYHGKAKDAAGYIRESIVDPNAYIVPGDKYHTAGGQSVMPPNFSQTLTPSQIDDLVAYLLTLK